MLHSKPIDHSYKAYKVRPANDWCFAEPSGSMPPRLAPTIQTAVQAEKDFDMHLTCSAQGNPPPNFK